MKTKPGAKPRVRPNIRNDYHWFLEMPTRWADNDMYGHVNNVAYYGFFDTAVNRFLIDNSGLDIHHGAQIGLVVETGCHYFAPLSFPSVFDIGLRVERVGNTSVTYGLGVFGKDQTKASAQGRFVHVYVDRTNRKPIALTEPLRRAVMTLGDEK